MRSSSSRARNRSRAFGRQGRHGIPKLSDYAPIRRIRCTKTTPIASSHEEFGARLFSRDVLAMTSSKCQSCGLVNPPGLSTCRRCNAELAIAAWAPVLPYGAPLASHHQQPAVAGRFRILAVVIGWIVDIVGSNVVGLAVGIVFGIMYARAGMKPQQFAETMSNSPVVIGISLVIGLTFTAIGGFVAAHMGRSAPIRHALGVGILSAATGVLTSLVFPTGMLGFGILGIALTIPMAVLGGAMRRAFGTTQQG